VGLLNLFSRRETRSATTSRLDLPESWLLQSYCAAPGAIPVNGDNALTVTAIYACVRILAESVASLPLKLYRKQGDSRTEATDSPLHSLLKDEPNEYQTSFEFREMMQGHLGVRGNAYARITKNPQGVPIRLQPIHPADVEVRVSETGRVLYRVRGESSWLDSFNVLHLKGMSSDGVRGLSPISLLSDTVGLALSAQRHGLKQYENGSKPGGVIQVPGNIDPAQIDKLRTEWDKAHKGVNNSGRPAILYGGMQWTSVGFSNEDAQFIESRKFDVEEIARAFRVPLHLLQSTEKSTSWGSGIEQQNIGFIEYTLRPWLVRWEQAMNRVLLTEQMKAEGYYFRFNLDALLRGDFKTRMEGYRTGIESGIYSINEVRRMEEMNPIEGDAGDTHYRPMNTAPAESVGAQEINA
jgi:HK97 family phage portal protein